MNGLTPISLYLNLILSGAVFLGVLLVVLLLQNKQIGKSRFALSLTILFLIFHLNTYLLFTTHAIKQIPWILGMSYTGMFLVGPLYFFFVKVYLQKRWSFKLIDILHLLPFILILFSQLPYTLSTYESKIQLIDFYYSSIPTEKPSPLGFLRSNAHMILIAIYTIWSLILIKNSQHLKRSILKNISRLLFLLAIIHMIFQSGLLISGVSIIVAELSLAILFVVMVFILSFWLINSAVLSQPFVKYKTSPISAVDSDAIENKLREAFDISELHLNPGLSISVLSKEMKVPSHHLSQVLSEKMETNFNDFVNSYRIKHAQKLLLSGVTESLSIEAIGLESGFGNKSSFYRAFKKFTKQTPSEFMNFQKEFNKR